MVFLYTLDKVFAYLKIILHLQLILKLNKNIKKIILTVAAVFVLSFTNAQEREKGAIELAPQRLCYSKLLWRK